MTSDLTQQFQFERILRDIHIALTKNNFTLETLFPRDLDNPSVTWVADRNGDKYVFTAWNELQEFSEICGDRAFFSERSHGF